MKKITLSLIAAMAPLTVQAETALRMVVPVSGSGDALAELVEAFNASQGDIRVTVQRFPAGTGYGQGLLTQLQSGSGPDVMFVNGGYGALEALMPMAEAGQLADLSEQAWAGSLPAATGEAYKIDDALFGLPLSLVSVGTVYNPSLIEKNGMAFPKTEEEMFANCAAAQANGLSFSSVAGPFPFYLVETIAVSKVYTADPDWNAKRRAGEVTFAGTQGWIDTLETYGKMAEAGCFQPGFEAAGIPDLFAAMAGEQTMSGVGPVTLAGAVMGMNPGVQLSVGPWPAGEDTVGIGYFNDAVAVNAASAETGAAMTFVDWLAQPDQLRAYAAKAGGTATVDVAAGTYSPLVAGLAPYYADQIVSMPHTGWIRPEVRDALDRGAAAYVTGQSTIAEVLEALDAAWDQ